MNYTKEQGVEFWFDFDNHFLPSTASDEVLAAYGAIGGPDRPRSVWQQARIDDRFPEDFIAYANPVKDSIAFLAEQQREVFEAHFPCDIDSLGRAFEDFGQGVLFDDRRSVGDKLHKMDTGFNSPPIGYHRWHPFIRAHSLTGDDEDYWLRIDRLVGLAWNIQSVTQPVPDKPDNPSLSKDQLEQFHARWCGMSFDDIDAAFDSFPFPTEILTS